MEDKSLPSTSSSRQDTLHLEVFTEFDKLPPWPFSLTVMASLEALCEDNDERRAPITLCAVIDRRLVCEPSPVVVAVHSAMLCVAL